MIHLVFEYYPNSLSCCSWGKISLWNSRICTFSSLSISAANFDCFQRGSRWIVHQTVSGRPFLGSSLGNRFLWDPSFGLKCCFPRLTGTFSKILLILSSTELSAGSSGVSIKLFSRPSGTYGPMWYGLKSGYRVR